MRYVKPADLLWRLALLEQRSHDAGYAALWQLAERYDSHLPMQLSYRGNYLVFNTPHGDVYLPLSRDSAVHSIFGVDSAHYSA